MIVMLSMMNGDGGDDSDFDNGDSGDDSNVDNDEWGSW